MRPTIAPPSQKAEKLPATRPERMSRLAPPSREDLTISRTCPEEVEVKTLTSSGMSAPARVPHVMIDASSHHRPPPVGASTNHVVT